MRFLPSLSEPAWVAVFPSMPHRTRLCLAAGLLQIHDFWDASHDAAQRADDQGDALSQPTGTASPIAASPTQATPHTGFAESASTLSLNRSQKLAALLDQAWRSPARRPIDLRRCLEPDRP